MDWLWDVKKEEVLDDFWSRQKDGVLFTKMDKTVGGVNEGGI